MPQLIQELCNGGHQFEVLSMTKENLVRRIEEMVLLDYIDLMKADGVKPLKQDKIDFMKEWRKDNQDLLSKAGLGNGPESEGSKFVSGIFFLLVLPNRLCHTLSVSIKLMLPIPTLGNTPSTHAMVCHRIETHFLLPLELFLGMRTRKDGQSFGTLQLIFILALIAQ